MSQTKAEILAKLKATEIERDNYKKDAELATKKRLEAERQLLEAVHEANTHIEKYNACNAELARYRKKSFQEARSMESTIVKLTKYLDRQARQIDLFKRRDKIYNKIESISKFLSKLNVRRSNN